MGVLVTGSDMQLCGFSELPAAYGTLRYAEILVLLQGPRPLVALVSTPGNTAIFSSKANPAGTQQRLSA